MSWPWETVDWEDPQGGSIRFYPYIPTVVYPRELRPRNDWDALAFLHHPDEREVWQDDEDMEKSGKGSATMLAIHGGGDFSRMLIRMQLVDEIRAAKLPDPEPRRLLNLAMKSDQAIYFVEPGVDDEDWLNWSLGVVDEASKLSRMIGQLFARRKFRKIWKNVQTDVTEPSVKSAPEAYAICAGLAATYHRCSESMLNDELRETRNKRLTSRLRGALADLIKQKKSGVLLVPIYQDWMPDILAMLKTEPEVEQIGAVA